MTQNRNAPAAGRGDSAAPGAQEKASKRALKLKADRPEPHTPPVPDHPGEGMKPLPFEDQAPSGALNAEGHRPVLERSRKVR